MLQSRAARDELLVEVNVTKVYQSTTMAADFTGSIPDSLSKTPGPLTTAAAAASRVPTYHSFLNCQGHLGIQLKLERPSHFEDTSSGILLS